MKVRRRGEAGGGGYRDSGGMGWDGEHASGYKRGGFMYDRSNYPPTQVG